MPLEPSSRAEVLKKQRTKARRQMAAKMNKGPKHRMMAEVEFRKDMAIILKIAGYTHEQIGASIGESKQTIFNWLHEPKIEAKFEALTQTLTESALSLLQTYTIEAVQTIVVIMRTSNNDKFVMEAAKEILDRGGIPKASRSISESTSKSETEITDTTLLEKIRKATPEVQEQAALAIEQLENLLSQHSESNGDTSS